MVCRCRKSVDFSLKCAWLLDAYSSDASLPSKKKPLGVKLRNLILSDELRPKDHRMTSSFNGNITCDKLPSASQTSKKTHQRSQSDASALVSGLKRTNTSAKLLLGDLSSGRAFDNGCVCFESCQGVVNDLRGRRTQCTCLVRIFCHNSSRRICWRSLCFQSYVVCIFICINGAPWFITLISSCLGGSKVTEEFVVSVMAQEKSKSFP